ncbi:MAG: hypothetical protein LUC93_13570 [Planctomycetaceae bacterium]|nr:hypothetical protein [Planctomycetaceae bacterium]
MSKVRVRTDQLTPGMKLGEPITNANGVTIMPSGIRLTPMFIARIRKWNIDAIDVLQETKAAATSDAGEATTEVGPEAEAQSSQNTRQLSDRLSNEQADFARTVALEISRTFVNVKNDPLMMQLRTVAIKRLVYHGRNGVVNLMRRHGSVDEEPAHGS